MAKRSTSPKPTTISPLPPRPGSPGERDRVDRFTRAYQAGDVAGVVALLTDDVQLRMPPVPLEYQGRELTARFLTVVAFRQGRTYRLVATRANGQPAFGAYIRDPLTGVARAAGLIVLTLAGDRISVLTRFDNSALPRFGKRARSLSLEQARTYYARWERGPTPMHVQFARAINQLMSLACYEQPEMMERVGYRVGPWIEQVTKKRLTVYADDVRAQERQILAPDPLRPGVRVGSRRGRA